MTIRFKNDPSTRKTFLSLEQEPDVRNGWVSAHDRTCYAGFCRFSAKNQANMAVIALLGGLRSFTIKFIKKVER